MTSFRVPTSKYRHVFSSTSKRENSYEGFRFTRSSCDNPLCAANPKFLAFGVDCGGGGAFQVIPISKVGRLSAAYPRFDAHSGEILDIKFNPFDDNMIATCSDDTTVKVWEVPEGEMHRSIGESFADLAGHQKKVHIIEWHPVAANVLLSAGGDNLVLVWNILTAEVMFHIDVPDQLFCVSWTWNGRYFATSSKDLFIRLYDPREKDPEKQMIQITKDKAHPGKKQLQIQCTKDDKIVSTGFGRQSERQYSLWSISTEAGQKNLASGPLYSDELDQSSGALFIVYDADSNMVYFVGKGDTTIRYFEIRNEELASLSFQSYPEPHRGVAVMPKRGVNIMANEIMRFYRVLPNKNLIEVVTWTVPRKSEMFQADLYPETPANRPALEADEWQQGNNADPIMVPIQSLQEQSNKESGKGRGEEMTGSKRAAAIAARAQARAQQMADDKFGSTGSRSHRYEKEKEAAGFVSNGHHNQSDGSDLKAQGDSESSVSQSKHIAQLVDEMRKLTLVVKAHEARIKELEDQVATAARIKQLEQQLAGTGVVSQAADNSLIDFEEEEGTNGMEQAAN